MNTRISSLASRRSPVPQSGESAQLDALLHEYLVWSAEALDVLVSLYEAADEGGDVPPEAARFATKIGAWEDRLSDVLARMQSAGPARHDRIVAVG